MEDPEEHCLICYQSTKRNAKIPAIPFLEKAQVPASFILRSLLQVPNEQLEKYFKPPSENNIIPSSPPLESYPFQLCKSCNIKVEEALGCCNELAQISTKLNTLKSEIIWRVRISDKGGIQGAKNTDSESNAGGLLRQIVLDETRKMVLEKNENDSATDYRIPTFLDAFTPTVPIPESQVPRENLLLPSPSSSTISGPTSSGNGYGDSDFETFGLFSDVNGKNELTGAHPCRMAYCGKTFSREDVLDKHVMLEHGLNLRQTGDPVPVQRRRRIVKVKAPINSSPLKYGKVSKVRGHGNRRSKHPGKKRKLDFGNKKLNSALLPTGRRGRGRPRKKPLPILTAVSPPENSTNSPGMTGQVKDVKVSMPILEKMKDAQAIIAKGGDPPSASEVGRSGESGGMVAQAVIPEVIKRKRGRPRTKHLPKMGNAEGAAKATPNLNGLNEFSLSGHGQHPLVKSEVERVPKKRGRPYLKHLNFGKSSEAARQGSRPERFVIMKSREGRSTSIRLRRSRSPLPTIPTPKADKDNSPQHSLPSTQIKLESSSSMGMKRKRGRPSKSFQLEQAKVKAQSESQSKIENLDLGSDTSGRTSWDANSVLNPINGYDISNTSVPSNRSRDSMIMPSWSTSSSPTVLHTVRRKRGRPSKRSLQLELEREMKTEENLKKEAMEFSNVASVDGTESTTSTIPPPPLPTNVLTSTDWTSISKNNSPLPHPVKIRRFLKPMSGINSKYVKIKPKAKPCATTTTNLTLQLNRSFERKTDPTAIGNNINIIVNAIKRGRGRPPKPKMETSANATPQPIPSCLIPTPLSSSSSGPVPIITDPQPETSAAVVVRVNCHVCGLKVENEELLKLHQDKHTLETAPAAN